MRRFNLVGFMVLGLSPVLFVSSGCGESKSASSFAASEATDGNGGSAGDGADAGSDAVDTADGADGVDGLPPEQEQSAALAAPVGGEKYVFIASETLDAVVRIDALALDIDLIEIGIDPTAIRGFGEGAGFGIVVANTGSEDVSIVQDAEGDGERAVVTLDAGTAVNQLEISPDGRIAIAWFAPGPNDPVDMGSLQEVRAIVLGAGKEAIHTVGVGFRPLSVDFGVGDDAAAYVVTERGVSRIALDASLKASFAPPVAVTPDPLESAEDREVIIAKGTTAIVRRGGVSEVRLVALATGEATIVATTTPPTDIDVTPDENEVFAVLREDAALLRFSVDDPTDVTTVDLGGRHAGQVTLTPDGKFAALHTSVVSAADPNEWVVVLDVAAGTVRTVPLEKSVRAVEPSPDGKRLVVLHAPVLRLENDLPATIDAADGFSLVDVASGYAKLELLDARPLGVVMTPNSLRGFVLVPDPAGGQHAVMDVDLGALSASRVPLGSPPVHAVAVGGRLAIAQDHASGRVTFLDMETDDVQTVTGFQLNGLIR